MATEGMRTYEAERLVLRTWRDLVAKLSDQTGVRTIKPMSASYGGDVNTVLLKLARDGLRFRLLKLHAVESAEPDDPLKSETFLAEIDRQLDAL